MNRWTRSVCALAAVLLAVTALSSDAQTPACGTVITADDTALVFDSDMVCPAGFTGTALTVQADRVTVDGAGHHVEAPDAAVVVTVQGADLVTVANLDLSGNSGRGVNLVWVTHTTVTNVNASGVPGDEQTWGTQGITLANSSDCVIADNTVHHRYFAVYNQTGESNNLYTQNDLSDNQIGIIDYHAGAARSGNTYTDNDVSRCAIGIVLYQESDFTLSGNDYTDCVDGLKLVAMSSINLEGHDFSPYNITGTALRLISVTNSTISHINASGAPGTETVWGTTGIYLENSSNNVIADNTVHNRYFGVYNQTGESNNLYTQNDLSDNQIGIIDYHAGAARSGNTYTDNDVSRCAIGIVLYQESDFTLSGNDYTDCADGLKLVAMSSINLEGHDFSPYNITGTALRLISVTNSTISHINASGAPGTETVWGTTGIYLENSSNNVIADNTVHNRYFGVYNKSGENNNTYARNNLTGNNTGILDYWAGAPRAGNVFLENVVSGVEHTGIGLYNQSHTQVAANSAVGSWYGISLNGGDSNSVTDNVLSQATGVGIAATNEIGLTLSGNTISGCPGKGLVIAGSADAVITLNNIFGNAGYQVEADTPIELSSSELGNYWGRSCPGDLFVPGVDSNRTDAVDSWPYAARDAWLVGDPPGCGVTPPDAIPAWERAALIALYESTGGEGWSSRTNWRNTDDTDFNDPGTECTWRGVVCAGDPPNVTSLVLGFNHLVGFLPDELGDLGLLDRLDLRGNQLSGGIPTALAGLPIRELWLSQNQLSGGIEMLCDLAELVSVELAVNSLSGPVPSCLQDLSQLQTLHLVTANAPDGNLFDEAPPPLWLVDLPALESVSLGSLSGPLPTWLGSLTGLRVLALVRSPNLTGPIPSEIGLISSLEVLDLRFTGVDGPLAPEVCDLSSLTDLLLTAADLSGSIPPCLGGLGNLHRLWLQANQLTGTIPPELGDLSLLDSLYLHQNHLEGPVPQELGNLTGLGQLLLSGNMLSGELPGELVGMTSLAPNWLTWRYNAYHTEDPVLVAFLDGISSDWQSYQTVAPVDLTVGGVTTDSVELSWSPIAYTSDPGRYRVLVSTSSGGPYVLAGTTADKLETSATVAGLADGTTYYFVVEAVTDPHLRNPNTVVSEASLEVSTETVALNDPPSVDAGPTLSAFEGAEIVLASSFADPDAADLHTAWIDWGDGTAESGSVTESGGVGTVSGLHVYADDGDYPVTVTVTDPQNASGFDTTHAVVLDAAPVVGPITAPLDPILVGTTIAAAADFTDAGVLDHHAAEWSWGDGSTSVGIVTQGAGWGHVSGEHRYTSAGVHTVGLRVTDDDGGIGEATFQFVVAYDPSDGFVTGGGWFDSPPGSLHADPSASGKATLGFNAKYHKNDAVPSGQTQFTFHEGGLDLHSTGYDWLVVTETLAYLAGSGTLDGGLECDLLLTLSDGDRAGGDGIDRVRLQLWSAATGEPVYDSEPGAPMWVEPTTVMGGGSIKIHD